MWHLRLYIHYTINLDLNWTWQELDFLKQLTIDHKINVILFVELKSFAKIGGYVMDY